MRWRLSCHIRCSLVRKYPQCFWYCRFKKGYFMEQAVKPFIILKNNILIPVVFFSILNQLSFLGQIFEFVTCLLERCFSLALMWNLLTPSTWLEMLLGYKIKSLGAGLEYMLLLWDVWSWFGVPSDLESCCQSQLMLFSSMKRVFLNLDTVDALDQIIFLLCVSVLCIVGYLASSLACMG